MSRPEEADVGLTPQQAEAFRQEGYVSPLRVSAFIIQITTASAELCWMVISDPCPFPSLRFPSSSPSHKRTGFKGKPTLSHGVAGSLCL